jgi:hypothetical protein
MRKKDFCERLDRMTIKRFDMDFIELMVDNGRDILFKKSP